MCDHWEDVVCAEAELHCIKQSDVSITFIDYERTEQNNRNTCQYYAMQFNITLNSSLESDDESSVLKLNITFIKREFIAALLYLTSLVLAWCT